MGEKWLGRKTHHRWAHLPRYQEGIQSGIAQGFGKPVVPSKPHKLLSHPHYFQVTHPPLLSEVQCLHHTQCSSQAKGSPWGCPQFVIFKRQGKTSKNPHSLKLPFSFLFSMKQMYKYNLPYSFKYCSKSRGLVLLERPKNKRMKSEVEERL